MSSIVDSPVQIKKEKMDQWDALEGTSSLTFEIESWDEGDSIKKLFGTDWEDEEDGKDPGERAQALIDHMDKLVKLADGYEQGWYGGGDEKAGGLLLDCLDGVVPGPVVSYEWDQPTPPDSPPVQPQQVDSAEYLKTYTELNELLIGKPATPTYQYACPEVLYVNQSIDGYTSSSPGYASASPAYPESSSPAYTGSSSPGYSSDSNASSDASSDPDWSAPTGTASPVKKTQKLVITVKDDRKIRKKEQNKNAATRYRQKKKQEQQEILGEEKDLLDTNTALKDKVTDLKREMKYLKSLLRDVYKAKGLIQ